MLKKKKNSLKKMLFGFVLPNEDISLQPKEQTEILVSNIGSLLRRLQGRPFPMQLHQ